MGAVGPLTRELVAWTQIYSVHKNRSYPPTGQSRCHVSETYTAPPSAGQTWQHLCSNSEIKYIKFSLILGLKHVSNVFECWFFFVSVASCERHVLELQKISMRHSFFCLLCSYVVFINLCLSFIFFSYYLLFLLYVKKHTGDEQPDSIYKSFPLFYVFFVKHSSLGTI